MEVMPPDGRGAAFWTRTEAALKGWRFPGTTDALGSWQAAAPEMLSYTEFVTIGASSGAIWTHLADFERWWMNAHPKHIRLEILSGDKSLVAGMPIEFEAWEAGAREVASGWIVSLHQGVEVTWEGNACLRALGVRISTRRGTRWQLVEMTGDRVIVSATVWRQFPKGPTGSLLEWIARRLLGVLERGRQHRRQELRYLRDLVEGEERRQPQRAREQGAMATSA